MCVSFEFDDLTSVSPPYITRGQSVAPPTRAVVTMVTSRVAPPTPAANVLVTMITTQLHVVWSGTTPATKAISMRSTEVWTRDGFLEMIRNARNICKVEWREYVRMLASIVSSVSVTSCNSLKIFKKRLLQ